jgi:hypothetical protein
MCIATASVAPSPVPSCPPATRLRTLCSEDSRKTLTLELWPQNWHSTKKVLA